MIRVRTIWVIVALLGFGPGRSAMAQDAPATGPEFKEVYELIRTHLAGVTEDELNSAAVRGLISALSPRVSFASNSPGASGSSTAQPVTKALLFEGPIAYVRIARVGAGLGRPLREAYGQLSATNHLKGLVLDLRFADGVEYEAVPEVAELFLDKDQGLLDWGKGLARGKASRDPIQVPCAVLVNDKTAEAAEALAAVLRQSAASLILGNRTAGRATIAEEFPLKDGVRLRIATTPVHLADGAPFPPHGLEPDVTVEVTPEEDRAYFADAFAMLRRPPQSNSTTPGSLNVSPGTNRTARRPRVNEAELVRERKESQASDAAPVTPRERDLERPIVRDPVLVRALDFLKGLALVRSGHS